MSGVRILSRTLGKVLENKHFQGLFSCAEHGTNLASFFLTDHLIYATSSIKI